MWDHGPLQALNASAMGRRMTGSAVATGRFIYLLKGGGLGEVMVSGFPLHGGLADYVKRKEIHRRAAERCTMVLKNRGGLEGMVALPEPLGLIRGSRFSLFFVFFPIRVLGGF